MGVDEPRHPESRGRRPRRVPILALFGAAVVSSVGNNITNLGPWFVLQTTGSAVRMGITGAVMGIGQFSVRYSADLWRTAGFQAGECALADLGCGGIVAGSPADGGS